MRSSTLPDAAPGPLAAADAPSTERVFDFSIVVPTFDRPRQLERCLESLWSLDAGGLSFEIVVVNDGPRPLDRVPGGQSCARAPVAVVNLPHVGPAAARNAGAARARGRYLAFVDDDCLPSPGWLTALRSRLCDPGVLVGGRTANGLEQNPYSMTSQLIIDLVYAHHNVDPAHAHFFASNNLGVARDAFLSVGGFDARFVTAEDREFCRRWLRSGRRLAYAADALVRHEHPLGLRTFWRQHFAYGRGAMHFYRAAGPRWRGDARDQAGLYLGFPHYLRAVMTGLSGRQRLQALALLAVWQIANTAGGASEAMRRSG